MSRVLQFLTIAVFLAALAMALPSDGSFAAGSGSGSSGSSSGGSSGSSGNGSGTSSSNDYNQAVSLIDDKQFGDAIPLLKKVVAMEPSNADAYNYLGYAHRELGKRSEALIYYEKALSLQPKHLGANEYLGELYLEMKQLPKADERLSVLQSVCGDCQEYEDLKEQIDDYKAKQQS